MAFTLKNKLTHKFSFFYKIRNENEVKQNASKQNNDVKLIAYSEEKYTPLTTHIWRRIVHP